ncbi:serine hydrolase [Thalassospira sp. ER-Se-21-Dark]|uniref:serine hydrolase domain-containing protein n=1 Tax=Thalassospira sp. ER-Se-21-Dark TaxID=2585190 RepID=UPI001B302D3C|nr:serine hydrolase [Thalassospira sp. ER-Se-21-Dark]MBP3127152.1 serine hydrolase [Thalassospira sp. ER-Se-21-Dark]
MLSRNRFLTAALVAAGIVTTTVPALAKDETSRWLTPTMINARAHMFSSALNVLTFQHMDQIFATRTVEAGNNVWVLPEKPVSLDDGYTLDGETVSLAAYLEATSTNALVVVKDGTIVHESYRNGSDANTRFMTFSVAKSYVSTLIGLALDDGFIKSLDDKVTDYLPEMAGSGYDGPTIRNLLHMRSGVEWQEIYQFGSDTQLTQVHDNSLVAYKYRWCDYAANDSVESQNKPGDVFNYATLDTSVLGCVLERAVGKTGAEYMSEKLWKPAGMENDAYWVMDGPEDVGREFFGAGLNATARDHARFGLMFLNKGQANGKQIVPADWIDEATIPDEGFEPTALGEPFGYQYQWWTIPGSDAYSAIGLFHQFIYVDPENNLVIVKASHTAEPVGHDEENLELFRQIAEKLSN